MLCNRFISSSHHVIRLTGSLFRQNKRTTHTSYITSCKERDLSKLSTRRFWQNKYTEKNFTVKPFDWFIGSDALIDDIEKKVKETTHSDVIKILDVGCGTSSLPGNLYSGVNHPLAIYCVDYIPDAVFLQQDWITQSTPKHSLTSSHFVIADVCALPWKCDLFDVIVDKGTMDALLKDGKIGKEKSARMMKELGRLVNRDGVVLQVSDEDPEIRLPLLEKLSASSFSPKLQWTACLVDVFGSLEYFMYFGRLK